MSKSKKISKNDKCKDGCCRSCFNIHGENVLLAKEPEKEAEKKANAEKNKRCTNCHDPNCRDTRNGHGAHGRFDHFCWSCGRDDCADSLEHPCRSTNICIACRAAGKPGYVYCTHTLDSCTKFDRTAETRDKIIEANKRFRTAFLAKKEAEKKTVAEAEKAVTDADADVDVDETAVDEAAVAAEVVVVKMPQPKSITFPAFSTKLFPSLPLVADDEKKQPAKAAAANDDDDYDDDYDDSDDDNDDDNGEESFDPEDIATKIDERVSRDIAKLRSEVQQVGSAAAAASSTSAIAASAPPRPSVQAPAPAPQERMIPVFQNGMQIFIPESAMGMYVWQHQQQLQQQLQMQQRLQQMQQFYMMAANYHQ